MSTPPQEPDTQTIALDREERWVVHNALTDRVDDDLDAGETPSERLVSLLELIEEGEETLTEDQVKLLTEVLSTYAETDETPPDDRAPAGRVLDRLAARR